MPDSIDVSLTEGGTVEVVLDEAGGVVDVSLAPAATLEVVLVGNVGPRGPRSLEVTTVTADTSARFDEWVRVDATSGAVAVTLPDPADGEGRSVEVTKVDASAHAVTVDAEAGTVEGDTSVVLNTQRMTLTFRSTGSSWEIV